MNKLYDDLLIKTQKELASYGIKEMPNELVLSNEKMFWYIDKFKTSISLDHRKLIKSLCDSNIKLSSAQAILIGAYVYNLEQLNFFKSIALNLTDPHQLIPLLKKHKSGVLISKDYDFPRIKAHYEILIEGGLLKAEKKFNFNLIKSKLKQNWLAVIGLGIVSGISLAGLMLLAASYIFIAI